MKVKGGSWLACESDGTAYEAFAHATAFAASQGLDSSTQGIGGVWETSVIVSDTCSPAMKVKGGSWLACESGGTANEGFAHAAAIAASQGLDSFRSWWPDTDLPVSEFACNAQA